jgi:hypothetical protein
MPTTSRPAKPGARSRRFWILLLLIAGGVSAAFAVFTQRQERAARLAAAELERQTEQARRESVAQVGQTLRAMKLITVEVKSTVESASTDESWRGDVHASVRAPVTYYYGVDLSHLGPEAVRRDPLTGTYTIRVPRPVRLATEVLGADELTSVRVSGTRFRDLAGEYYLGLARIGLYDRAREARLGEVDRRRLDETTRAQVAGLIRALAGRDARVDVEYAQPEPMVATPEPLSEPAQ